jgi:hypothetical protein
LQAAALSHFATRAQKHKTHQPDHLLTVGMNQVLAIYLLASPAISSRQKTNLHNTYRLDKHLPSSGR